MSSPSVPVNTLPYELLFDCLDYAAINSQNILLPDYRCLRTLSLVAKQVSHYAQKILFRSVYLSKNRHAFAFGNALNPGTEKGRWLASLVRTLKAQVRGERGSLTQQLFTAALLACPNLNELDLDVASYTGFDMSPFSTVFISRASPIQALRIAAPSATGLEFLRVFPSLKFVEFKYATAYRVPHGSSPACQLTELHWPGPLNDVLHWTLHNSVGELEIFGLHHPSGYYEYEEDQFEKLLSTHGASLRSLHLPSISDSQALSLRHCTQLEEFIYEGSISETVIGMLPETIEHLQLQTTGIDNEPVYSSQYMPHLLHYIETAPSLLTLTWIHQHALSFTRLREPCERRGVIWRGWMQPHGTYPGERQELGYVETFPRIVSMSPSRTKEVAVALRQEEARAVLTREKAVCEYS